jgi:ABC-type nitrate/sulfonate/bicarbonate transport system substrate-binding protein
MRRALGNRTLVTAGVVVCVLFGAGPMASGQGPAQITIATVNNMNHVPQFVAVEKGLYVKHGVDVKLRVFNDGASATRAVQAGEAQMATIGNSTLSAGWNAGIRMVAVAVVMGDATRVYYDDPLAIVTRSGSGIRRLHVEDLVGKRVGMIIGGTGEEYFRAVLAKEKIPPNRINFVNVPSPDHVSVLRNGGVDAEVVWEPYGTMILQQIPGAYVVLRGGGYLGWDLYLMGPDEFVKRNPRVVDDVVRGFVEAAWYVRQHPVESALIATRWIEGLDPAAAKKAITYMDFDPRFSANIFRAQAVVDRVMLDRGRIKQAADLSKAIDTSFIDRIMREVPEMFADLKPVP